MVKHAKEEDTDYLKLQWRLGKEALKHLDNALHLPNQTQNQAKSKKLKQEPQNLWTRPCGPCPELWDEVFRAPPLLLGFDQVCVVYTCFWKCVWTSWVFASIIMSLIWFGVNFWPKIVQQNYRRTKRTKPTSWTFFPLKLRLS